jgi:phosphoglycerate kinase
MNTIRKIQDADIAGKKVLLRVDFNVEVENGKAKEKFKIAACKETVDYILSQEGAKLALLSHLGRPSFEEDAIIAVGKDEKAIKKINAKYSLKQLQGDIESVLGRKVIFISDCIGEKVRDVLADPDGEKNLLLENVRLYEGDEINDNEFAAKLADNFDIFANDAFGVCHRDQASVAGVARILPSFAGFRIQKEIENLDKVKKDPDRPAVAIIGGAKIETKLSLIYMFEANYDCVLVGGKIANEAVDKGVNFSTKTFLPLDYAKGRMDIGQKTIEQFKKIIKEAKTIVWNGPMGRFEEPPFDQGTRAILEAIIKSGAFSVVGGGESIQIIEENNLFDKISFVSTGGGAMLEYLSGNPMPGIEVLMV